MTSSTMPIVSTGSVSASGARLGEHRQIGVGRLWNAVADDGADIGEALVIHQADLSTIRVAPATRPVSLRPGNVGLSRAVAAIANLKPFHAG